jgi:predicted nucleic acid-binding protein
MEGVFLDTSVYIGVLRREFLSFEVDDLTGGADIWLSAVVLQELYAGANDRIRKTIVSLENRFALPSRIVVPELDDWIQAGNVLALVAAKYHYEQIGRGRLTNDALIAMSAARLDLRIITANATDFRRLAEFRPFQWQTANF